MIEKELYSLQLEKHVLGGLIRHKEAFADIEGFVSDADFYQPVHRTIYSVIRATYSHNQSLDKVILAQKVKELGLSFKDDVNIFDYIDAISFSPITKEACISSCKELIKYRICRELVNTGNKIVESVKENIERTVPEILCETDKIYNEKISQYDNKDEITDLFSAAKEFCLNIAANPIEEIGLITPFKSFNTLFGGIRSGNGVYAICSRPKSGKALEENTPIPTPNGWTAIKDLKAGDEVFSSDGTITKVVGTMRWENRSVFKIITSDGDEIIADENHEWLARPDRRKPNDWKIIETKNIEKFSRPVKLPLTMPIQTSPKNLPIHPYVLGLWLGNGTSSDGSFTCLDADGVFYTEKLKTLGYALKKQDKAFLRYTILSLKSELRECGVLDNKHIPDIYLRGSIEQRKDLVRGLMDTDGYVSPKGKAEFCNTNKKIAYGFWELLKTLGIKASIGVSRAKLYGKDCGEKFRINFHCLDLVSLPRKAQFLKQKIKKPNQYISAQKIEKKMNTVCIQVEHPSHLFLCGKSMIPTHNSTFLLEIAKGCVRLNPKLKVLYLDTEMKSEVNKLRGISSATGIPMWWLETGKWINSPEYRKKFESHIGSLDDLSGRIFHKTVCDKPIDEICSLIRRWFLKEVGRDGIGMVVYDYIKLTGEVLGSNWSEHQAIGEKITMLNKVGTELNIPIWTACQLNRSAEDGVDDSSAIAISDRLQWYAAFVAIFRRKRAEELLEWGVSSGSHLLKPTATRFQGKEAAGHNDLIMLPKQKGQRKPRYEQNFINFDVKNFKIDDRGTLEEMAKLHVDHNDKNPNDGHSHL